MPKSAIDPFFATNNEPITAGRRATAVTPSATSDLVHVTSQLWVNMTTPGMLSFIMADDPDSGVVNMPLPIGFFQLYLQARRITAVPAGLNAPTTAALAASTTGGSLATGTVYVKVTYVNSAGETIASSEASVAVTGPTASVTVTSPANVVGATGYNVYSSGSTGTEKLTNSNPISLGTNFTITALGSGVGGPGSNTTGSSVTAIWSN